MALQRRVCVCVRVLGTRVGSRSSGQCLAVHEIRDNCLGDRKVAAQAEEVIKRQGSIEIPYWPST